ncbi:hypothetical protein Rhe02_83720 [Rhizocola hellebori]|uniref:Plasmid replication initiator protein n=1 Tax=Rhizocola hellebori TaxID=1392758 RepID=A0A8J3QG87_9ACTN|nr:replication initiator [Rhizocola hellebori]GIH10305.1 hypothetical protein Rhe02_83720 [Rhizocola hellebori]
MTVSTLETASHATTAWGAASNAENRYPGPEFVNAILARTGRGDYEQWLDHITAAAACSRPIRLSGNLYEVTRTGNSATLTGVGSTATMPDGVIYKACGNRRASLCPACSKTYQQDAYQIIRAGLVGGRGIPDNVATHPAVFATFTAPSFGKVHSRYIRNHPCTNRRRCECRPEPCHARRAEPRCAHGRPAFCFARHEEDDPHVGKPLCLDCYDHERHVIWNRYAGELWRRTKQAIDRHLAKLAKQRGISRVQVAINPVTGKPVTVPPIRVSCGKVAEFQARGVVHFHVLLRIDGVDAQDPAAIVRPPAAFSDADLHEAVKHAAKQIRFGTPGHPDQPRGWLIGWGDFDKGGDVRTVAMTGTNQVSDSQVAGYLAKYATKSTEAAGLRSTRLDEETVYDVANFGGNHLERLLAACWKLGRRITPRRYDPHPDRDLRLTALRTCSACGSKTTMVRCETCHHEFADGDSTCPPATTQRHSPTPDDPAYFQGLQRWAHMLGFGGHFYTQSRRYSITFTHQRNARTAYRRTQITPQQELPHDSDPASEETTLVISSLAFAGIGWHTSADAILANTAAALAREKQRLGREELAHLFATATDAEKGGVHFGETAPHA